MVNTREVAPSNSSASPSARWAWVSARHGLLLAPSQFASQRPEGGVRPDQQVLRIDLHECNPRQDKKRELVISDARPGRERLLEENLHGEVPLAVHED